ncbi:hypothetical protein [Nitrosococcus wardiae]|uniref:hypothetical protein n=1 Tax=Nitrosococcus wardiae TaxID=1814290 RepID=UPI00141A6F39|nr:hypothetical protein [Nitrosococcus wardiae]
MRSLIGLIKCIVELFLQIALYALRVDRLIFAQRPDAFMGLLGGFNRSILMAFFVHPVALFIDFLGSRLE